MKRIVLNILFLLGAVTFAMADNSNAKEELQKQDLEELGDADFYDDFETNNWGWTEYASNKEGTAIIRDGKMHMEWERQEVNIMNLRSFDGKKTFIESHCYAPFDFTQNFMLKVTATVKEINADGTFGVMFNWLNDGSFWLFKISEEEASLLQYNHYELIGEISDRIKFRKKEKKNADVRIKIELVDDKYEFYINDIKVLEVRYLPKLESSAVGFILLGKQKVDFDNMIIIQ